MIIAEVFALHMLVLHGPDNAPIEVNPAGVVSLREPRYSKEGHVHPSTKCLIFTQDGKFVAVKEDCATVQQLLAQER